MNPNCEEMIPGQLNAVDRFSDLPYFIIHRIIHFLGTRQAYRTSILSKRWAHILATTPYLEFHYYCNARNYTRYWPSKEVSTRLLEYIDTKMQRYSIENLRIKTLRFRFPNTYEELGCEVEELDYEAEELEFSRKVEELSSKVDDWIRIAVCNQVARLGLDGPINYQLPDILLSANSLSRLDCTNVELPCYNKAINLASLQILVLFNVVVEEDLLNHIISSSLLLECLSVEDCVGFKTIVIPCCSQLKELTLTEALPKDGTLILEASSLTCFQFSDLHFDDRWPVMSKPGLLRNLTVLDIFSPGITDEQFGKLLPELVSLEGLQLSNFHTLRTLRISSNRIKEIYLNDCPLEDVTINAPSLTKFEYEDFGPHQAITISSQASCDISVHTAPDYLDTRGFFKLKKLMTGVSSCNALKISLTDDCDQSVRDDIKFVEEELGDVNLGAPRVIRELKLTLYNWKLSTSSVSAFLNGLFWTCNPDIISFQVHLKNPNLMIQHLMSEIENMANCWRHPLKRVEVEGANCSNLLKSKNVDVQLRLHW